MARKVHKGDIRNTVLRQIKALKEGIDLLESARDIKADEVLEYADKDKEKTGRLRNQIKVINSGLTHLRHALKKLEGYKATTVTKKSHMIPISEVLRITAKKSKDKDLDKKVVQFLVDNPNPPDTVVHSWADKQGIGHAIVEAAIYRLATKFAKILAGGKAVKEGVKLSDFDPEEVKAGIKVELEHTPDRDVAERIVLDHLAEFDKYYTHPEYGLLAMEKKMEEGE
jgi:hypothetical protein